MRHLALLLLLAVSPAWAGGVVVHEAVAAETVGQARAGVGYMTLLNEGDEAVGLVAVEAAFPKVMLHRTEEVDGVMKMTPVDAVLEIKPGDALEFSPGGLHVMFMGLDGDSFEVGEVIPAELVFASGARLPFSFEVRALDQIKRSRSHGH